jgi:excisionase family DNA binding protein
MKYNHADLLSLANSEPQHQPLPKPFEALLPVQSWLTAEDAATRVRISKDFLLRAVRKGRGPAHVGQRRLMRFRAADVDAWAAGGFR